MLSQDLVQDLVAANRILYRQGVVDGFGHVSVRHPARPDRFLIAEAQGAGARRPPTTSWNSISTAIAIDRRGRAIYSERFIHSEVYKAPARTSTPSSTATRPP